MFLRDFMNDHKIVSSHTWILKCVLWSLHYRNLCSSLCFYRPHTQQTKIFIRHSANLVYLFWENIFAKMFISYLYDIFLIRGRVPKVCQLLWNFFHNIFMRFSQYSIDMILTFLSPVATKLLDYPSSVRHSVRPSVPIESKEWECNTTGSSTTYQQTEGAITI